MAQALPHPIMYTAGQQVHYLPQYYSAPYAQYDPSSYPERTLRTERRRPKYTRSKTGCLTCRRKKVKCDETKPTCQRCSNSQLSCTWPEIPPPKKKVPARKGRSPADQADSAAPSEAGTSSVSPTDTGNIDGTPLPSFQSEVPSPEIEQDGASGASSLAFADPNLLHVGNSFSSDRRHSEPHLMPPFVPSANELRRHSLADITDGQQYTHHNSHQEHQYNPHSHNHGVSPGNGALGLSLDQFGTGTRPSTPSDFLYPHTRAQASQQQPLSSSSFLGLSSTGNMAIIPNISTSSASSRPSTAASSLSLSHSLQRTSASSRPSTAGSYIGAASGASINGHQFMHRPASSSSGSGAGDYPPLGLPPFSFQLGRTSGDMALDGANVMSGYTSACISRPSTANSVPSAAPSPYMRHGVVSLDGSGSVGIDRWHSSPLLGQSPLAQPQPQAVVGAGLGGYFQQMTDSPSLHSRTQSPAWAC
ncbi:hypothetical protein ACEPAG_8980 [Sanghuangporus baumii]